MADETPQVIALKERHWATSRKFLGFLLTSVILTVSALIVKNSNYAALSLALVSTYSAFAVANATSGFIGAKSTPQAQNCPPKQEDAD